MAQTQKNEIYSAWAFAAEDTHQEQERLTTATGNDTTDSEEKTSTLAVEDTDPTAAQKALFIYEIVERILSFLSIEELARAQRLCHRFNEIIEDSPILQQNLFLKAAPIKSIWRSEVTTPADGRTGHKPSNRRLVKICPADSSNPITSSSSSSSTHTSSTSSTATTTTDGRTYIGTTANPLILPEEPSLCHRCFCPDCLQQSFRFPLDFTIQWPKTRKLIIDNMSTVGGMYIFQPPATKIRVNVRRSRGENGRRGDTRVYHREGGIRAVDLVGLVGNMLPWVGGADRGYVEFEGRVFPSEAEEERGVMESREERWRETLTG